MDVIVELLRNGVRQRRESAVLHSDREARSLHVGLRNVRRIGVFLRDALLGRRADGRAVSAPRGGRIGLVYLLRRRIVSVGAEGGLNGPK